MIESVSHSKTMNGNHYLIIHFERG